MANYKQEIGTFESEISQLWKEYKKILREWGIASRREGEKNDFRRAGKS